MRKLGNRWLKSLTALAAGAVTLSFGCSGWPGPLAIFGGSQGLLQTIGLQVAAEVLQAAMILILGPTSVNGPFPVPGVTA